MDENGYLRRVEPGLGHLNVPRAHDELYVIEWMYWPLDDADLKAIAGGIGAFDGSRCATAVAGVVVAGRVRCVDGRVSEDTSARIGVGVVADEDKVGTTGVFLRHEESERHGGERTGDGGRFALPMASPRCQCIGSGETERSVDYVIPYTYTGNGSQEHHGRGCVPERELELELEPSRCLRRCMPMNTCTGSRRSLPRQRT